MTMRLPPPIGHHVDVRGRALWTHRSGTGGPTVVFIPGAGGFGLDLLLAHEQVAQESTAVLYDRAGTGWSDDIALPRSADEVTDELRDLLRALGVPTPYVLVGHSLGGLYARRYAQRFAGEVAGLLLLDPAHEDWDRFMPDELQFARNQPPDATMPELPDGFLDLYRGPFAEMFAAFPADVRDVLVDAHLGPQRLPTGFREGATVLAVFDELRAGVDDPTIPLVILSGTATDAAQRVLAPEARLRKQIAGAQDLYDAVAGSPGAEHRSLDDASHVTIPMARPDAVAAAVKDLIALGARQDILADSHLSRLRRRADGGDSDAVDELIELAAERGDADELCRFAADGNTDASDLLIELATEREDLAELRCPGRPGQHDRRGSAVGARRRRVGTRHTPPVAVTGDARDPTPTSL